MLINGSLNYCLLLEFQTILEIAKSRKIET